MLVDLNLDWELLAQQKAMLLQCMKHFGDHPLDGLVELIDSIQDDGAKAGEPVVYLEEDADAVS